MTESERSFQYKEVEKTLLSMGLMMGKLPKTVFAAVSLTIEMMNLIKP